MPSQQSQTAAAAQPTVSAAQLEQLSPQERLIAALLFYEKLTFPETAEIMQLPEEAVRLLLTQILSRLTENADSVCQSKHLARPSEIIR